LDGYHSEDIPNSYSEFELATPSVAGRRGRQKAGEKSQMAAGRGGNTAESGSGPMVRRILHSAKCFKQVSCTDTSIRNRSGPALAWHIVKLKKRLCTHLWIYCGGIGPSCWPGSIHDTDRIAYRCFLPDLTRFVTVCCVASDQNGPSCPTLRSWGGSSAPH